MKKEIDQLDFEKANGLLPCIVQDADTQVVLMLGYMSREALDTTLETGVVTFFSRTKNRLWTKGETSGNYLDMVELMIDCDQDTLLVKARPRGPVCHTGSDTCFNEVNQQAGLGFLEAIIADRKANPQAESYTTSLFQSGINKMAQKVGEEAVELVIEAKDSNDERFLNEAADLMYHFLVLLSAKGQNLDKVVEVLKGRHQKSTP